MRVLVTGASGFIGSHLVEAFVKRGDDVTALVRPSSRADALQSLDIRFAYGDVREPLHCRSACRRQDCVVHTAAVVGAAEAGARVSIDGTKNMLEAACVQGVRHFIHMSSAAVYERRDGATINEQSPMVSAGNAPSAYARGKRAAEKLLWNADRAGRLRVTAIRPSVVLGARDRNTTPRVVRFLRSPLAGWIGDGANRIPCVDVRALKRLVVRVADNDRSHGKAYNASGTQTTTQRVLFALHAVAADLPLPRRRHNPGVIARVASLQEAAARVVRRRAEPVLTRFALSVATLDGVIDCSRAFDDLGWTGDGDVEAAVTDAVASLRAAGATAGGDTR
jgi:nucleoside-diphosphate-sugar epimerase